MGLSGVLGAVGCAGPRAASRASVEPVPLAVEEPPITVTVPEAPPVSVGLRPGHAEPDLVTIHHRVAPGETMYRIARNYGLTVEELAAANGIKDPRGLSVGQELLIPTVEKPAATEDEEPELMVVQPGAPLPANPPTRDGKDAPAPRAPARPASATAKKQEPATKGLLDWPLKGVLYGRFGKKGREPHDGIDLAAPEGSPVRTAQEGTVLYAGEQHGYGLIVIVQHEGGLITIYAHNKELRVTTGQKVRRTQVVATVGESGRTSGPHLHFEVRVDGKPVDPIDYLGALPSS